jgi:hypothetical protein
MAQSDPRIKSFKFLILSFELVASLKTQNLELSFPALQLLPRHQLLKIRLGLVQHGLTAVALAADGRHQIPGLECHVQLQVSHIFRKIFAGLGQ